MSLVSVQITCGAIVVLPWNIIGGYSESSSLGELYEAIKDGTLKVDFWNMSPKYNDYLISTSIGRSKTDSFDNISANVSVLDATSTFGRYIMYKLHKPEPKNPESSSSCNIGSTSDEGSVNPNRVRARIYFSFAITFAI